jgi:hypothetical protein
VRLSEFKLLLRDEFGAEYGAVVERDLVLGEMQDRTAKEALLQGEDPREVWLALCRASGVPRDRWLGLNKNPKKRHAE